MLARMTRNLQTSSNYAMAEVRELPGGDFELRVDALPEFHAALGSHPGMDPHFMRGTLETLLEMCGERNARCELRPAPPGTRGFTFLISLGKQPVAAPERKARPTS
jgi:hypothetical protein